MSVQTPKVMESGLGVVNDCWNRIGVRGDKSCPELVRHIHCRNCPVYRAAGRALLDAAPPEGHSAFWTAQFAEAAVEVEPDAHSVMIFRVGVEWFGVPTRLCVEVTGPRSIHSLPHRRRGALLVCVSLAAILHLVQDGPSSQSQQGGAQQRLLVIGWEEGAVAMPVDEVHGVTRFREQDMRPVPATVARAQATYTRGVLPPSGRSAGLLDTDLLYHTIGRSLA
jgi:chemotaxis-related protein WspD